MELVIVSVLALDRSYALLFAFSQCLGLSVTLPSLRLVSLCRRRSQCNVNQALKVDLEPPSKVPGANPPKLYAAALKKGARLFEPMRQRVLQVGQSQLLRRQIASELNFSCKLDSSLLMHVLQVRRASVTVGACCYAWIDVSRRARECGWQSSRPCRLCAGRDGVVGVVDIRQQMLEGARCTPA